RSRLLHGVEDFLKRNDRDHCCNDVLVVCTTEYGFRDRERHLLSRTNDLRPANYEATTIHVREHFANAGVNFIELDYVGLKGAVQSSINGPECKRDQVWIFLKGFLESQIVSRLVQRLDAA